jgi:hypothetical protein
MAGSLAAHAVVLAFLALPHIEAFPDRSNDEDALTLTLERPKRQAPPAKASAAAPASAVAAPSRIQPRAPRLAVPPTVAPLVVGRPATIGTAPHPAPLPGDSKGDLRSALRGSGVGCANAAAVGLTRREIEKCDERWGEAARKAPVYANAPISAGAGQDFARAAARQEANRRYKASPMGPGVDHRDHGGPGQAKDIPFVLGDTDGLGRKKSDQSMGIKP